MGHMHMNARWRRLLLVLLVLSSIGLGYGMLSHPNLGGERWRQAQTDNVRETVFRWQIVHHRKDAETCFLTVHGLGAVGTAKFVTTHFRESPYVKPLPDSLARARHTPMLMNTPTINGFVDAGTGKPALNFWTDSVIWRSDTRAEVEGGGAAAMGSGNEGTFSVVWSHHRWEVTGYKMGAIF